MEYLTMKKSNCKNCYKCIRYCPVKSIRFSGNQAHLIGNECILCGRCYVVCPQDAKQIVDETEQVRVLLQSRVPVYVSLAPSFAAYFAGVGIDSLREAIQKLGFADAEETALGATVVKKEYDRLIDEGTQDVIITSCCHSVNLLIQKYFPAVLPYLAPVISPMQAHCRDIKQRHPEAKVVFVGPCIAKKDEAQFYEGFADAVLTFDELEAWFKSAGIELRAERDETPDSRTRLFPTTGGILRTMAKKNPRYTYIAVDTPRDCIAALQDIESGKLHNCFIEMSACTGSCIGGPVMLKSGKAPLQSRVAVDTYAGRGDFDVAQPDEVSLQKVFSVIDRAEYRPTEEEIRDTLRQMGKTRPTDELNCGTCGYDTCRDKAIAILQGKAEISMCLPYLKEKAENFSDTIARNTPNGIIVLNEKLEVQQVNKAALRLLNLRSPSDILGEQVVRILSPDDFMEVLQTMRGIHDKRLYLAEYEKYVEETIVYDREYRVLLCILRDVTEEELEKEKREKISSQTVEIADRVVDKQMRIVQEIASLLGETAAETKIALTKLKESIGNE